MPNIVADANAFLSLILPDESQNMRDRITRNISSGDTLMVPAIWHLEMSNVPLNKLRRNIMTQKEVEEAHDIIESFSVKTDIYSTDPSVLRHVWNLAMKYSLTTYDASYLELAVRMNCQLLTDDAALIRGAVGEKISMI